VLLANVACWHDSGGQPDAAPKRGRLHLGVLPFRHDGQNTCCFPETCQAHRAKINLFAKIGTQAHNPCHPALTTEGVSRSPRCVARGAVDAIVPQGVRQDRVRPSRVVLAPRRWCQASGNAISALSPKRRDPFATGTRKPEPRGEYGVSRKAIAQGVPVVSAHLY